MSSVYELARFVREALATEAEGPLEEDRAVLAIDDNGDEAVVRLVPRNEAAASLEVFVETGRQVTCCVGGEGLPYEIFSRSPNEIVAEVRGLAREVVAGRYSERVKEDDKTRIVANWRDGDKLRQPRYNVFRAPASDDPDWHEVTYEAYT
jgi:hypothetical protein